jgi:hypothetical protein
LGPKFTLPLKKNKTTVLLQSQIMVLVFQLMKSTMYLKNFTGCEIQQPEELVLVCPLPKDS